MDSTSTTLIAVAAAVGGTMLLVKANEASRTAREAVAASQSPKPGNQLLETLQLLQSLDKTSGAPKRKTPEGPSGIASILSGIGGVLTSVPGLVSLFDKGGTRKVFSDTKMFVGNGYTFLRPSTTKEYTRLMSALASRGAIVRRIA